MRIVAITQARTGSTRLPGKVLMEINGNTLLGLHLQRIQQSKKIDELIVATTTEPQDNSIVEVASNHKVETYRGSVDDVLDRFYQAIKDKNADYVVRLTSDCPLIDPALIDKVIAYAVEKKLDYCSNTLNPTYPDGEDIEVFKFDALKKAWKEALLPSDREHVTPFIWKNSSFAGGVMFSSANYSEGHSFGHLRITVDEMSDLELIKNIVSELGTDRTWLEYAEYIEKNKSIKALNETITRNEGYQKSLNTDTK
jgi:spore coat polysaccharide biosynthesis protein SpsF